MTNNITKIIHISDVHIRNFKRHEEYRKVFKKLYKFIKENHDEETLIYLAGDIVHSKTDMTPELVLMVSDFLNSCADIGLTVLIAGNHDANLNNDSRLDALTPIVNAIRHPNLLYWKDSGVYTLGNIGFSVFSVFGPTTDWVLAKDMKHNYKVCFFHGAISSAITELDHTIVNEYVKPNVFDGFDMVMAGDIHRTQTIGSYNLQKMEVDEAELALYLKQGWEVYE